MIEDSKKVVFVRASEIHREPRAEKEAHMLLGNYKIEILCWDREKKISKIRERRWIFDSSLFCKG